MPPPDKWINALPPLIRAVYDKNDAKAEYDHLQTLRQEEKKKRQKTNALWPCFDCGKEYPKDAFWYPAINRLEYSDRLTAGLTKRAQQTIDQNIPID